MNHLKCVLISIMLVSYVRGMKNEMTEQTVEPVTNEEDLLPVTPINITEEIWVQNCLNCSFEDYQVYVILKFINSSFEKLSRIGDFNLSSYDVILTKEAAYIKNFIFIQWLMQIKNWLIDTSNIMQIPDVIALIKLLKMNMKYAPIEIKCNSEVTNNLEDQCKTNLYVGRRQYKFIRNKCLTLKREIDKIQRMYQIRYLQLMIINILKNVKWDEGDKNILSTYPRHILKNSILSYLRDVVNENDLISSLQEKQDYYLNKYQLNSKLMEKITDTVESDRMLRLLCKSLERKEEKMKKTLKEKREIKTKFNFLKHSYDSLKNCETILMNIKNEEETPSLESMCNRMKNTKFKDDIGYIVKNIEHNLTNHNLTNK